jgi:hypothetical protein
MSWKEGVSESGEAKEGFAGTLVFQPLTCCSALYLPHPMHHPPHTYQFSITIEQAASSTYSYGWNQIMCPLFWMVSLQSIAILSVIHIIWMFQSSSSDSITDIFFGWFLIIGAIASEDTGNIWVHIIVWVPMLIFWGREEIRAVKVCVTIYGHMLCLKFSKWLHHF